MRACVCVLHYLHRVAVLNAHVPDDHSAGALLALLDVEVTQLVAEHVRRVPRQHVREQSLVQSSLGVRGRGGGSGGGGGGGAMALVAAVDEDVLMTTVSVQVAVQRHLALVQKTAREHSYRVTPAAAAAVAVATATAAAITAVMFVIHRQPTLSSDQLRAASLIGRNAVT